MKEALYTIPVNDAFNAECECPVCMMYRDIEKDAIEFTMGPSYMEDDIRAVTDKKGFCAEHAAKLYRHQNRLGLGLILNTHLEYTIKNLNKLIKNDVKAPSLFKKKAPDGAIEFLEKINSSCYICDRIAGTFDRYIATIFHLYHNDSNFSTLFAKSKGFCTEHYILLYKSAEKYIGGHEYEDFINTLNKVYLDSLKEMQKDLEWFTDKFDYRNADAPWKNSKDALPRTIQKTSSINVEKDIP